MREDRQWATAIIWNKKPNHKQGIVSKRDTFKMEVHLSKNNMTRAHCLVIICFSPLKITEKAIFPSIILSSKKSMTILQKDLLAWLQNYECSLCEETLCTSKLYWNSILSICPSVVKCSSLKKSWLLNLSLFGLLFLQIWSTHFELACDYGKSISGDSVYTRGKRKIGLLWV